MKPELNLLNRRRDKTGRRAPSHLFGGRVRTSTVVLVVAFLAIWWTYETYRPHEQQQGGGTSPSQVVPPGFVPDPNYTWVPRTRVEQPQGTPTPTTTPPTVTPPPPTSTPTSSPGPLPCLLPPPFCPPSSTPNTPQPNAPQQPSPPPAATVPAR